MPRFSASTVAPRAGDLIVPGSLGAHALAWLGQLAGAEAHQLARDQGETLPVTPATLWKRLDERGLLASREANRQRLTVRITVDHARLEVLHLSVVSLYPPEPSQPSPSSHSGEHEAGADSESAGAGTAFRDGLAAGGVQPSPKTAPLAGAAESGEGGAGTVGTDGTVSDTKDITSEITADGELVL